MEKRFFRFRVFQAGFFGRRCSVFSSGAGAVVFFGEDFSEKKQKKIHPETAHFLECVLFCISVFLGDALFPAAYHQ